MISEHHPALRAGNSGVSEFALTAQQVTHAVKATVGDFNGARSAHCRLRMKSHSQTGRGHHRQIIGTITNGNTGLHTHTQPLCEIL